MYYSLEILKQRELDRFHSLYSIHRSCWIWNGSCTRQGYGRIRIIRNGKHKQLFAHRISYYIFKGVDPCEKLVCHKCDNPQCVNPAHLFLGTHLDNHRDRNSKGRQAIGERNGQSIFTGKQVRDIKK